MSIFFRTMFIASGIIMSLAIAFFSSIEHAFAALAQPASDTLSRQMVSVASNHTLQFVTPSGIDSSTDTITLRFADFNFGSVGETDIDLQHGPTTGYETADPTAGTPSGGVWGVAISGTTMTLTAPTDAVPGTISAGDTVVVRIGTHAGGTHQVMNPTSPMVARILIAGSFGDVNVIEVPIISNDSVSVTATVPEQINGGGGGGGGPGDTVSPLISNVQAVNVTTTSATITWDTDEYSDSRVEYGLDATYTSGTVFDGGFVASHLLLLSGLTPSTVYHFRVSSRDSVANQSVSGDYTFTTAGPAGMGGDVTSPFISAIQVTNITDTSALVTWMTDEPATSVVTYGVSVGYGMTGTAGGLLTTHAVYLTGLLEATSYHFSVGSADFFGNMSSSPDGVFTTLTDVTAPTNVSSLHAVAGDTTASLTWVNPMESDVAGITIVRKVGGFPTGPMDGVQIYTGIGTAVTDSGLINGTTYFYGAYAFDTHGNVASGALASALPFGGNPPTPTSTLPAPPIPTQPPTSNPPGTPSTPIPPSIPGSSGGQMGGNSVGSIGVHFFSKEHTVELVPDSQGSIGVLSGSVVDAVVSAAGFGDIPSSVILRVDSASPSLYFLKPSSDGTSYTASFTVPEPGKYLTTVIVTLQNGSSQSLVYALVSQAGGRIVEEALTGPSDIGVEGAIVQLYRNEKGGWVAYGRPRVSQEMGAYSFVVPNGEYYAEVSKDGFRTNVTPRAMVDHNVFNQRISLIRIPQPLFSQNILALEPIAYGVKIARAVIRSPEVQTVNAVVAPLALAIQLANVGVAASLFNALAYLQYLFTQPFLLFGRNKRKKWGIVFNALTKQPVDLAIVRLLRSDTRAVVQTRVTDRLGRYAFIVKEGKYLLEVVKPGYVFPTTYLHGVKEDGVYTSLFHGEMIEAKKDDVLTANIPLDPIERNERPKKIVFQRFGRRVRDALAFSVVPIGIVSLAITPSVMNAVILLGQVALYLFLRRVSYSPKAKNWGAVTEAGSKAPLQGVVVRIFECQFNKLLETQVTGRGGTFGFFVRQNVYYVTAEKTGYVKYRSPNIDLRNTDEALVDQRIVLKKG